MEFYKSKTPTGNKKIVSIPKITREIQEKKEIAPKKSFKKQKADKNGIFFQTRDLTNSFVKDFPPVYFKEVEIFPRIESRKTHRAVKVKGVEKNKEKSQVFRNNLRKINLETSFVKVSKSFVYEYSTKYKKRKNRLVSPWGFESSMRQSFIFPFS